MKTSRGFVWIKQISYKSHEFYFFICHLFSRHAQNLLQMKYANTHVPSLWAKRGMVVAVCDARHELITVYTCWHGKKGVDWGLGRGRN